MAIEKILTPAFRVAFPSVFKKRAYEGGDEKYEITMLFPKNTDISLLQKAADAALDATYSGKKARPKGLKFPFRDGDEVEWDGYAGCTAVKATSLYRPNVVDRKLQTIDDEELFYAGCWARATVNAFCYDKKGNKGVTFGLQNVQFLRDDEPFTGRTTGEEDFDELPDEDGSGGAAAPDGLGDLA